MRSSRTLKFALAGATSGLFLALVATASPASADPVNPAVPPTPIPAAVVPAPVPPVTATLQAAGTDAAAVPPPPQGVPHLASPDALPPGSTMDPSVLAGESPNVSYLKDLWHAVQTKEISGKEALLLGVAQRGMNTPYPEQAPGPNVPISPGNSAPAGPAPAGPAPSDPAPAPAPVPPPAP